MSDIKVAFDVRESAAALSVSEQTVRKLIADGRLRKLPYLGRAVRVARVELERFAAGEAVAS